MSKDSTWGEGEEITLETLKTENISGKWLNLAAGDGRYVNSLLKKVNHLVLADIDQGEINKTIETLTEDEKKKIEVSIFDMTKEFPLEDGSFDGVLCTGTLHLFGQEDLKSIFKEITRILKPSGKLIIDFATDVKKILQDDNSVPLDNRPDYTLDYKGADIKELLEDLLKGYETRFQQSEFEDDLTNIQNYGFKAKGKFFLVIAKKK